MSFEKVRPEEAGFNCRDPDAERLDLMGNRFRQALDRKFCSAVGPAMLESDDTCKRADIDDPDRCLRITGSTARIMYITP